MKRLKLFFACLLMAVLSIGQVWGKTYKLTQVSSVSAGNKYVFVQEGYAMGKTCSSSALQTTNSYKTTGLAGNEDYVWTLETATGGFKMRNVALASNYYLTNSSSTGVSFGSSGSVWAFNFQDGGNVEIQNKSNSDRFLGFTNSTSHAYKAYATSNISGTTYPHVIYAYVLEEEASCSSEITITKGSNPANGTFVIDNSGKVCIDAGNATVNVTATPNEGYHLATVTSTAGTVGDIDGNTCAITGINANTTINVTFAANPKYTVSFNVGASSDVIAAIEEDAPGAGVTLPAGPTATCASDGWVFAGWKETTAVAEATTTAPTLLSGTYHPAANCTLYAVYKKSSGAATEQNVDVLANDGTFDTDHITFTALGGTLTFTQIKATSSTNVNSTYSKKGTDSNRPRVYKGQTLKIESSNYKITKVEITVNSTSFGNSITASDAIESDGSVTDNTDAITKTLTTTSGGTHTFAVVDEDGVNGVYIQNVASATNVQLHPKAAVVYYLEEEITYHSAPTCTPPSQCKNPTFSPAAGEYNTAQSVTLASADGATIYYTTDGNDPDNTSTEYTGTAIPVTQTTTIKAIAIKDGLTDSEVAEASYTLKCLAPTITKDADHFLSSVNVTLACETAGAAIHYTLDGSNPTGESATYSAPFSIDATTTIKAIAVKANWSSSEVASETFTKANILSVSAALTAINALADNGTIENSYVSGVISQIDSYNSTYHSITYWISADGTTTNQLQVYSGLAGVVKEAFASEDDLSVGADVTIFGTLKKYVKNSNTTPEFDKNNVILAYKPKAQLAWTGLSAGAFAADLDGENSFPTIVNSNSVTVEYSSSNTDAATINASTGEISLVAVGSTTITASFTGNDTYKANSVSYTLNVASSVAKGNITYNCDGATTCPEEVLNATNLPDELPVVTKAGKNFGGWFTDPEKEVAAVPGAAISENTTLYAKWLDPYNITAAKAVIDATPAGTANQYVAGKISQIDSYNSTYHSITYWISDDGTTTNQFQVYSGLIGNAATPLGKEQFSAVTDLELGDEVVVFGTLKLHNSSVYEFDKNNTIYTFSRKAEAGIEWGVASFDAYIGESNTFPTLTNPNSLTVAYSSSNETAATIDPATGAITLGITPNVNTTITASFAGNSSYKEAEVSYTLNVYNPTNPGTITYEENGGSEVADVTTPVDNFPDPLPTPTKENYIFAGWWTTSTFNVGTQAVAGAPMDGNVILYAKWTEIPVWAYTYTSNVTLSGAKVKFYGESTEYDAVKAGTGSAAGSTSITVPAQATKLHFHAYGWKGETVGLTVTAPAGVTVSPATEISINSNDGMTSNSPFTLAEGSTPMTDAYYVVSLSGNDDEIELTFTATSGKRFVLFGVNQEGGVEPELDHITITGELTNKDYELGDELDKTGLTVTAYYTLAGATHHDEDVTSDVVWSNDPLTGGQTSVDVTATYGGKSDTKACAINAVVVPTPEIILSESALEFSGKQYGAVANKTFNVTLKNVAAATVALSGDDAAKFSIDPASLTANGTVTVSVANTNVAGSFSATITVSDDAAAAAAQTVALTLTITADEAPAWNAEWVEATELYDGMPILITGVNSTTSKIYAVGAQNSNNRAAVEASVDGNGVLTPGTGTKQFTLEVVDAENNQYAIKTSDGKYLYAAGSGSGKNYLRSQATNDNNGVWTLTTTSAEANGTNTNKYMKFNTSGMFSCYSSGQTAIKLYTPKSYTRNVSGNYGTICLPKAGVLTNGALYEISYYDADQKKIFFDEVEGGVMVAGAPYIFKPNENVTELKVAYTDATVVENAGHKNGLYGHYDLNNPTEGAEAARLFLTNGDYFLRNNEYWLVDQEDRVYVDNYRAYIKLDMIGNDVPPQAYGRRRVAMNVNGEQVATGFENLNASEKPVKLMIDGNIYILRGEKLYDTTGRLVK